MTRLTKATLAAALAAAVALPSLALADFGGGPRGKRGIMSKKCIDKRYQRALKRLAEADKNGDGEVDDSERDAMRAAKKKKSLATFDKDGDGVLSRQERRDLRHAKMVERFEKIDTNRDAKISKEEAKSSCSHLARKFDRADTDGDGDVSWTEFEAAGKHHMKRRRMRHRRGMKP